jgi:chemotaxis protein MotB
MSIARRSRRTEINIWPAFVDALGQLVIAIVFLLLIFTVAQFLTTDALSGRDQALQRLTQQIAELADLLNLEKRANADLQLNVATLSSQLQSANAAKDALTARFAALGNQAQDAAGRASRLDESAQDLASRLAAAQQALAQRQARLTDLEAQGKQGAEDLAKERQLGKQAQDMVALLNQQIAALRDQLQRVSAALALVETKDRDSQAQIADLGRRLNLALASKVEELARFRSEFFGRLREVLGDRQDIRVVGDRFIFQSEVLFAPASAELGEDAKTQLTPVATAIKELIPKIPTDLNWVLRVDGHTDRRPINTPQFPSNWELSTGRAISVVKFLVLQGVPPDRLAAAGFGEFVPIDSGNDEASFRRNRRIELKLTDR